jgi:hypothetical protein
MAVAKTKAAIGKAKSAPGIEMRVRKRLSYQ